MCCVALMICGHEIAATNAIALHSEKQERRVCVNEVGCCIYGLYMCCSMYGICS